MKRLSAAFFLFFLFLGASTSPIHVEARAWKKQVTIGDEIRVSVRVEHPRHYSIIPPSPGLKLEPFELKRVDFLPFAQGKNRIRQTLNLTLTVFELGDLQIPPIPLEVKSGEGKVFRAETEALPVKVVSVGRRVTDKDDVRPIKGPVSLGFHHLRQTALIGFVVLLSILLGVLVGLRWKKERALSEARRPPHERACLELERLKNKGFLEEGKAKEFYSGLADVLRRYLERRFGVEAMELTTAEIMENMKTVPLEDSPRNKMREFFQNSDLVKFAKFVPPRAMAGEMEKEMMGIIESTKSEARSTKQIRN